MLTMLGFLLAMIANLLLFFQWQNEKRQKALAQELAVDRVTRQRRRYQDSTLFGVMFGSTDFFEPTETFQLFVDKFDSFSDVTNAMRKAGLSLCDVVIAVDFTASNEWQGRRSFNKHCLHAVVFKLLNPYQQAIASLGATLQPFVGDRGSIHAFGFGDRASRDRAVFSFRGVGEQLDRPFHSFSEVLARYTDIARRVQLAGPTSFAPVISKTIQLLRRSGGRFHVLVIISDGQMGEDEETVEALVQASHFPLSIILVGVGDGPWHRMEEYDDRLPKRRFDNFQFVDYHKATAVGRRKNPQAAFALQALMELPDQYKAISDLGYL